MYVDNVILFSATAEEHLERLIIVFGRLRLAGLKLKPEKCALFQKSVFLLGHVVSENGISTDPSKIKAVVEWPVPKNFREFRAFLGLAGYYRRFVLRFSSLASPLNAMMGKGKTFAWTAEAQQASDQLKTALVSPPIFAMPTDSGEFILDTDAAHGNIGAVLFQVQGGSERVIAYASRKLNSRKINYCVTRQKLLAVVYFLQYFRQYLLERRFRIRTDHSALTWLNRTPNSIGQQTRWLEIMEEFDFVIEHRKGSRHTNADALSRRPCRVRDCLCRQSSSSECIKECVQRNEKDDAEVELEVRMAKQASCRGHCSRDQLDQSPVDKCSIGGAADEQNEDLESSNDNAKMEAESGDKI